MAQRGESFVMMTWEEAEKVRRLADPARAIRRRLSRLQRGILAFLDEHDHTSYRIVRQAFAGQDKPITPSFKASFSRSVAGLVTKRFVVQTHEPTGLHLARHPDWAAFQEAEAVNHKGLKANKVTAGELVK